MTSSLASAFRSGNGRKAKWQGKTVRSLLQISIKDGDSITINRLGASTTRAQALKLAVDKGNFRVNGILASTVAIWTHTSPETTVLEVVGRRARSVDIWNSWSFDGVDSAWLGNAGMLIGSDGATHTVRCSDGLGEPTFDDLVVKISVNTNG